MPRRPMDRWSEDELLWLQQLVEKNPDRAVDEVARLHLKKYPSRPIGAAIQRVYKMRREGDVTERSGPVVRKWRDAPMYPRYGETLLRRMALSGEVVPKVQDRKSAPKVTILVERGPGVSERVTGDYKTVRRYFLEHAR